MELKKVRQAQRELIHLVLERANLKDLSRGLAFSYLGARVCYHDGHPLNLFSEEKFKDKSRFVSFLLHLKKAGHFSVFAHTPIVVGIAGLKPEEKYLLAKTYFKAFFDEERELSLFNLRHFAEALDETQFLRLISVDLDLEGIQVRIFKKGKDDWAKRWEGSLASAVDTTFQAPQGFFATQEVILLEDKENPFLWTVVIAHNFSRIFSHQFVRHTWLNFNQRSHRYTQADFFIVPSCFKEKHVQAYQELIEKSLKIYHDWSREMKKESARFILPQGVATTVLASAPRFIWEDFVEKRAIPQAQEEIQDLAILLKNVLF